MLAYAGRRRIALWLLWIGRNAPQSKAYRIDVVVRGCFAIRVPVATVFENLEVGSSIEEIIEQYDVTREQIQAVLEFAARSLDAPPVPAGAANTSDAHPV
jgi:hypothetical protein